MSFVTNIQALAGRIRDEFNTLRTEVLTVANNLSDVANTATARTNLDVYSKGESATAAQGTKADNSVQKTGETSQTINGNIKATGFLESEKVIASSALGDIISLFQSRFNLADMYGFGVASSVLYYKSFNRHQFYSNKNFDSVPNGAIEAGTVTAINFIHTTDSGPVSVQRGANIDGSITASIKSNRLIVTMKVGSTIQDGTDVQLGTLPVGYRPDRTVFSSCIHNKQIYPLTIEANGDIIGFMTPGGNLTKAEVDMFLTLS